MPLLWQSVERVLQRSSPTSDAWYCYERQVSNKTDRDVTDIFWKVAGFEKDLILKQRTLCDTVTLPGNLKQPHPEGPLYYSIGTRSYPTVVYSPQNGYSLAYSPQSGKPNLSAKIVAPRGTPDLSSVIEVSDRAAATTTQIRLASSVHAKDRGNQFDYELTSSGPNKFVVYWFVPLTNEFNSLEMNRKSPAFLVPGATMHRSALSSDPIGWTQATVQIFDNNNRWLATGIASVYCSINGKPEPPLAQPEPRQ
jgi:hypothetical protein